MSWFEKYQGLTYCWPGKALKKLGIWKRFFCPRKWHLFDESCSSDRHVLHCDACGYCVGIAFIEEPEADRGYE